LGNELGFKNLEDWYRITQLDIHKNGGELPPKQYNNSPSTALQECLSTSQMGTMEVQKAERILENRRKSKEIF